MRAHLAALLFCSCCREGTSVKCILDNFYLLISFWHFLAFSKTSFKKFVWFKCRPTPPRIPPKTKGCGLREPPRPQPNPLSSEHCHARKYIILPGEITSNIFLIELVVGRRTRIRKVSKALIIFNPLLRFIFFRETELHCGFVVCWMV